MRKCIEWMYIMFQIYQGMLEAKKKKKRSKPLRKSTCERLEFYLTSKRYQPDRKVNK